MTLPFFGWLVALVLGLLSLESYVGIDPRSRLGELLCVLPALAIWGASVWVNLLILRSKFYKQYAQEFAAYTPGKRRLGSLLAFSLMLANMLLPFFVLDKLNQ